MPFPCIIDTDVAIDDWMAILYLLSSPQVDVRAITVAATGEAHAGPGVRTVLGLLALTETRGVQVAAGRPAPLRGQTFYLWDPLAAAVAVKGSLAVAEQVRLRVCQEPGPELGRVVEDPAGDWVDVCTTIDRVAFENEFTHALTHPGLSDGY